MKKEQRKQIGIKKEFSLSKWIREFTSTFSNKAHLARALLIGTFLLIISSAAFAATVSHPASQVTNGTFAAGIFVFPSNLNITTNISALNYLNLSGALEWIGPINIVDVDKEDIETDLNVFVDIAGDDMVGNLTTTKDIVVSGYYYGDGSRLTNINSTGYNTNSSNYWDTLDTFNATQMENSNGVLSILQSWLNSLYLKITDLPLENMTKSHCSNITGAVSDLCTITSGAGGNPFNQVLNTTSNVTFNNITVTQDIAIAGNPVLKWLYNQTTPAMSYTDTKTSTANLHLHAVSNLTGITNTTRCDPTTGKLINVTLNNGVLYGECGTDQTGGTGGGDGTGGWINSSTSTNTSLIVYIKNDTYAQNFRRYNTPNVETFFDEMNYLITAYNRITTAPTINTADADIVSSLNFPSAASSGGDGGLVVAGGTATNLAIINASKLDYFNIRAKFVAGGGRKDMLGIFKTATTVQMNTSRTGIFFYLNTTIANWTAQICDNGACSMLISNVINDTNWHVFTIEGNNRAQVAVSTSYKFSIDGASVGTISTNIPTTMVSTVGTWVESTDATADTLRVDWVYYEFQR